MYIFYSAGKSENWNSLSKLEVDHVSRGLYTLAVR